MQRFLLTLSGARTDILDRCPIERQKFLSLAWFVLITWGLATLSMWLVLTTALGASVLWSCLIAALWGLIILATDRWVIISISHAASLRWPFALARLVLALLIGLAISTPLVLRAFQPEINAQISVIKEQRASANLTALQKDQVGKSVTVAQNQVNQLEQIIDSGGAATVNPDADPTVRILTRQLNAADKLDQLYYAQWQCQLYGGSGCSVKGNGPLAIASQASYQQTKYQIVNLNSQIATRIKVLDTSGAIAEKARLSQARAALPAAVQQLAIARARLVSLQNTFDQTNLAGTGLLLRLQALSDLTSSNLTLSVVRIVAFLLILAIEILPVAVKLLQGPGNYEQILAEASDHELTAARRHYRSRPRSGRVSTDEIDRPASVLDKVRRVWLEPEPTTGGHYSPPQLSVEDDERLALEDTVLRTMPDLRDGDTGLAY